MSQSAEWCEGLAVIAICLYPGVLSCPLFSLTLGRVVVVLGRDCPFQSICTASVIIWPTAATEGQLHCVA